jgi:hypothetical protein
MDESTRISGGVPGINDYYQSKHRRGNLHKKDETKALEYRKGEIIRAKVIDMTSNKLAVLQLPSKTVNAHISQKLKQGDELFFIVEEVSPNLILNIYSVIFDTYKNISEMIRMLDVLENKYIENIILSLRRHNVEILRSEVLATYKILKDIPTAIKKNNSLNSINSSIVWLIKNKFSPKYFNELFGGFGKHKLLDELVHSMLMQDSNRELYNLKNRYVFNTNTYFTSMFALYDEDLQDTLLSDLQKIIPNDKKLQIIIDIAQKVYDWNTGTGLKKNKYVMYMPIISRLDCKVVKLVWSFISSPNRRFKKNSVLYLKQTKLADDLPNVSISKLDIETMKIIAGIVQNKLLHEEIYLSNFIFFDEDGEEVNVIKNDDRLNKKRISIVV